MPSSPPPINNENSRPGRQLAILIGDTSGAFPVDEGDIVRWLKPLRIAKPVGGRGTHEIELEILLDQAGNLQDITTPVGHNRIIEVRDIATDGGLEKLMAWGKIAAQGLNVSSAQSATISARIDAQMFGDILDGIWYWDGSQDVSKFVEQRAIFNPVIDGVTQGNHSSQTSNSFFAEPSAYQTESAADHQEETRARWTIAQAVYYVLTRQNGEAFVNNPTQAELDLALDDSYANSLFLNHELPLFASVPEMLDSLLTPYNFWWSILSSGDVGSVDTQFVFGKLGEGVERDIGLQRIGETISNQRTQLSSAGLQLDYDIVTNPNRVIGYPATAEREVSIKLYPGWAPDDDSATITEIDNLSADDYRNGEKRDVGRKWVVNEAGDYNGLRPEFAAAFEFPASWNHRVKRRTFLPALTLDKDGKQIGTNGYRLRYHDSSGVLRDFEWSFSILSDELGILIEGNVPTEYWDGFKSASNANKYLELTATIQMDDRIGIGIADRRTESPNGVDVTMGLDLSDRFIQRQLETDVDLKSIYADERRHEIIRVDTDQLLGGTGFVLVGDLMSYIKIGQVVSVEDVVAATTQVYEGEYSVVRLVYDSLASETIVWIDEALTTVALGSHGTATLNTSSEQCLRRVQDYCEIVRDDQDQALVAVNVQLHGIDHPDYLGELIRGVQPRNIDFNAYAGASSRYPQCLGVTFNLDSEQTTTLHLEQFLQDISEPE